MCAYSTDRTHIWVCSIVVFFAEFDRGFFCGCSWGGVSQLVSMNKNPVSMNGNIYRHFLRKIFL